MGKQSVISIILRLDDQLSKALAGTSKKLDKFGSKADKIGNKLTSAGRKLTKAVTLPLIGLGTAAIKVSNDFNKSMAKVGTLLAKFGEGPALKAIDKLKTGVLNLSKQTGRSSKDIAEGLFWVISAFPPKKAEDSVKAMEKMRIVTKAAIAGSTDTSSALRLLSAVTKAYGDTSNKALRKVSDLAFKTNELGQTTFPEMAQGITKVTALSAQLGLSQESLFGTFAALTGITGDASEVAVQLRGIFNGLLKPTSDMAKAMKHFNIQGNDLQTILKEKGLLEMMRVLKERFGGTDQEMAKLFPRVRAILAAFALTGKQVGEFNDKFEQMKNAIGATNDAFNIQQDHINRAGVAWNKLIASIHAMAISFGTILLPIFEKVVNRITNFVNWLERLDRGSKKTIIKIVAFTAALGPLLLLIGGITKAAGALSTALTFLFAHPMLSILAAGVALSALITIIILKFRDQEARVQRLNDRFLDLRDSQERYRESVKSLKGDLSDLSDEELKLLKTQKQRAGMDLFRDIKALSKEAKTLKQLDVFAKNVNQVEGSLKKLKELSKKFRPEVPAFIKEKLDVPRVIMGPGRGGKLTPFTESTLKAEISRQSTILERLKKERDIESKTRLKLTQAMGIAFKEFGFKEEFIRSFLVGNKEKIDELIAEMKQYNLTLKQNGEKIDNNTNATDNNTDAVRDKGIGAISFGEGPVHIMNESLLGRNVPFIQGAP